MKQFFEQKGISSGRLSAQGYGDSRPLPGGNDAQNRRVEIVLERGLELSGRVVDQDGQ